MTAYVSMRLEQWHDIFGDADWEEHFLQPAREKLIAGGFVPGRVEVSEDYITMWSDDKDFLK